MGEGAKGRWPFPLPQTPTPNPIRVEWRTSFLIPQQELGNQEKLRLGIWITGAFHSWPLNDFFLFLQSLDVPPAWEAAAARFVETGGLAMVLGGPDSGKSTLSRYLVYRAYLAGAPAALIDLDLGQSHVGPPAALRLARFPPRLPGDDPLFPESLYFVGQTSPMGAILEVSVGSRVLADQAREAGAGHLVVNTSGLVAGGVAVRLKRAQVELLKPRFLLALEREGELEPLLAALGEASAVVRLPVSARAVAKSLEARRLYRERRFREYFRGAGELRLPLEAVHCRGLSFGGGRRLGAAERRQLSGRLGTPVLAGEAAGRRLVLLTAGETAPVMSNSLSCTYVLPWSALRHRVVGLLDGGHITLALGLLQPSPWRESAWRVLTPLPSARGPQVRFLSLGRLRLSPDGRELDLEAGGG